jgi:hypothetical protein
LYEKIDLFYVIKENLRVRVKGGTRGTICFIAMDSTTGGSSPRFWVHGRKCFFEFVGMHGEVRNYNHVAVLLVT